MEVIARKSPGRISANPMGWANTISVFSATTTRAPSTVTVFTSKALAATLTTRSSARLLRRLNAIFADRDTLRAYLAVVADPRAAENRLPRLQIGAAARHEIEVLPLGRHQDSLLPVL